MLYSVDIYIYNFMYAILHTLSVPIKLTNVHVQYRQCVLRTSTAQCTTFLRNPINGQVVISGTDVGSTATYNCSAGYILNRNSTITCDSNGEWSRILRPTCEGI